MDLKGKRGLAVLVTCDYEGTKNELMATNDDAREMRATFDQFDYSIIQLSNQNATKPALSILVNRLSLYLKRYSGDTHNPDKSIKSIVFFFAGHGKESDQVLTNDGEILALKDVVEPLVKPAFIGETCHKIPKLFFIDACRGRKVLKPRDGDSDLNRIDGNFWMEYATIQGHRAFDYVWTTTLARMLREYDDTFQTVMAEVNRAAFQTHPKQRPQTMGSLSTGSFKLYYKS